MGVPSAGDVFKFKSWTWGDELPRWNFWLLKKRRKIKKNGKVKFEFEVEALEFKRGLNKYELSERTVTMHTIRSILQNKKSNNDARIYKTNDWDAFVAKHLLSS